MPKNGAVVTSKGIYYRFFSKGSFFIVGKENRSDTNLKDCFQPFAVESGSKIKDVTIEASIQGYPVLEIGNRAFMACNYLETVKLSSTIIQISSLAFYSCPSLKNINIPNSCKYLGYGAISCINTDWNTVSGSLAVKFEPNATLNYLGEYAIERKEVIIIFYCGMNPPSVLTNELFHGASSKVLFAPASMEWAGVTAIVDESVCLLMQENSEKQKVITCNHSRNVLISHALLFIFSILNE